MAFDYSKLLDRIVEKYGKQGGVRQGYESFRAFAFSKAEQSSFLRSGGDLESM